MNQESKTLSDVIASYHGALVRYFENQGANGEAEGLANASILKVLKYIRQRPQITAKHATNLLWLAARQNLAGHRRWFVRHSFERVPLDRISEDCLALDDDPLDSWAKEELGRLFNHELPTFATEMVVDALFQRIRGVPWKRIASDMRISWPTARRRVTRVFVGLIVLMAKRGLDNTLLDVHKQTYGSDADNVVRRWAFGMSSREIAVEVELPGENVRQHLDNAVYFFSRHL